MIEGPSSNEMPEDDREPDEGDRTKLEGRTLELFEESYARWERMLKKLAKL